MIISVVVPSRNEEDNIAKCIDHIYNNNLPDGVDIEVIIVDGLSDDDTYERVKKLQTKYTSLQIIKNEDRTTPKAFNIGIKHAKGDYIQIVGARQFLSPNYLKTSLSSFNLDDKILCVGGAVENVFLNPKSELIAKAMDSPFGVGGGNFRIAKTSGFVDTVGTPMYPKSTFEKFGLFDELLVRNQDDEFNYRITSNGFKIYQNKDAVIQYLVRASFKNLKKQYYQYGYWKVYVNKKVKSVTTVRQLFPAILVLSIFLGGILSILHFFFLALWLSGILSYILLSLYFAFKKSTKPKEVINIVKAFYILHFSYGFGYLKGILDFLILSKNPSNKNTAISR